MTHKQYPAVRQSALGIFGCKKVLRPMIFEVLVRIKTGNSRVYQQVLAAADLGFLKKRQFGKIIKHALIQFGIQLPETGKRHGAAVCGKGLHLFFESGVRHRTLPEHPVKPVQHPERTEIVVARDAVEKSRIWEARRVAIPALARCRPTLMLEDATVPRSKIPAMIKPLDEIAARWGGYDLSGTVPAPLSHNL